LLLGWARDRRPIPWDFRDADFVYAASDRDLFLKDALPQLLAAGFELLREWKNNEGTVTEYVLYKDKAQYEFWEMYEDAVGYYYYSHGEFQGAWREMICRLPRHGVETIHYLGRTWLKPTEHEEYLKSVYGDWWVPRPDYIYVHDDRNVSETHAYEHAVNDTV
jgi:hypothetical protein